MLPDLTTTGTSFTPSTPLTFARRAEPAELPELMDAPCPYPEFRSFLRDLDEVNRLTRAYTLTLDFLDRIIVGRKSSEPLRILDVGSGGGDTLRAINDWAAARSIAVELTGIDLNPHATRAAQEFNSEDPLNIDINFLTADIFTYAPDLEPDIVLSALFTHHLSTPEIIRFLQWMEAHARLGWFINDLHRSRRATFLFRFLPILFNWHPFIQYDGPVSLRRSFTPADWQRMLAQASVTASIEPHALNRLCVARIR